MILNSHLPIKAWLDPKTARLPGVQPVAIKDWLQRSDTFEAQIEYRRELIARKRETVFQATPEAEAACAELRDIIHAETAQDWTVSDHPLLEAAVNIQEDLCILQKQGDTHVLTAGVMCFPSSWDIREKIGRSISSIHEPVPEFADVSNIVERMLSAIRIEQPLGRANFLIYTDPELHQPRGEGIVKTHRPTRAALYPRRAPSFRRLPETLAVVFAIHTYVVPESALSTEEHAVLCDFKPELRKGF